MKNRRVLAPKRHPKIAHLQEDAINQIIDNYFDKYDLLLKIMIKNDMTEMEELKFKQKMIAQDLENLMQRQQKLSSIANVLKNL